MNQLLPPTIVEFKHFHLFCGIGAGAKGLGRGKARVGQLQARMRCVGGIDVDPACIRDFTRLAGIDGTELDLFSLEQYQAFHGRVPPAGWREALPDDIRRAAHGEFPDIVFLSAPCKGFSGLLPESSSKTDKYQALNGLTERGIWLTLEAFKDDPPSLFIFENVPRIMTRGRPMLDRIAAMLRAYGYAVSETTHDCGRLGGLGQSRKRFLMVARHEAKVPPFLYEPPQRRLRGVGEILEALPLPGDLRAGPMHRMPALQWKTWVRLAFVEAGSDWRSLNKLNVADGVLTDFGIVPDEYWQHGVLGVRNWDEPSGVVTSRSGPTNGSYAVADPRPIEELHGGAYGVQRMDEFSGVVTSQRSPGQGTFSVADPRIDGHEKSVQMGVRRWDEPTGVVNTKMLAGGGPHSVADPRLNEKRFNNIFRIVPWAQPSPAVAGPGGPAGGIAVAGPRPGRPSDQLHGKFHVTPFDAPARAVIAGRENGAFAVADPRPVGLNANREDYKTGGHYGVVPWDEHTRAVPGFAKYDRGPWAVADGRHVDLSDHPVGAEKSTSLQLPAGTDRLVCIIRALDGTWHRPFTTLELAALQSLVDPGEIFELDGKSDSRWREGIGNAVPPDAAEAIGSVMATTLLLAMTGETFVLCNEPIWVQPLMIALAVDHSPNAGLLD